MFYSVCIVVLGFDLLCCFVCFIINSVVGARCFRLLCVL